MEAKKHHYKRVAIASSLIFATLGVLSALLLLALLGATRLVLDFPVSIFVGIIALFVSAAYFGLVAGNLIYRFEGQGVRVWLIGIGLAWICLIVSVLAGSLVEFFSNHGNLRDLGDYIITSLFWVLLFGIIPALVLGLAYTATVKKFLR